MFRGNIVMKGYLKNKKATDKELKGGWFHSGDLGVMHSNGYIELKVTAECLHVGVLAECVSCFGGGLALCCLL